MNFPSRLLSNAYACVCVYVRMYVGVRITAAAVLYSFCIMFTHGRGESGEILSQGFHCRTHARVP